MDNHPKIEPSKPAEKFVPPRHWLGPEELQESYWKNPEVREKRGQEFHDKPIETIAAIDRNDPQGIARRDFLTIMGASMAMAGFACARRPVNKIIPYVVKPEEITPGVANYYASTCQECSSQCGVLVKTREGRPIKLEGNPDHPMNQGALCARGQASILNLYDPDRLKGPISRARGSSATPTDWGSVDSAVLARLKAISEKGGRVRVLSGELKSPATARLIRDFLSNFRNGEHIEFEPLLEEEVPSAQELSYGTSVVPEYRFDQAEVVLSLGADFLGNWMSPIENASRWIGNRKLESKNAAKAHLSKLFCFESTLTITGSNADERFAVRPGDELKIALALANELVLVQKKTGADTSVAGVLATYDPKKVAEEIGLPHGAAVLKKIAAELWAARGKSLVVGGGISSKTKDAVALQVAVNYLNSILGNEGVTVDGTAKFGGLRSHFADFNRLLMEMNSSIVDAVIIYRSNLSYQLPKTGFDTALKKVPLVIAISDRDDETAQQADFVLPDPHFLENWGDANPRKDLYSLQQPAIAPIHSTRAFQDTLLVWSKGLRPSGLVSLSADWHAYLKNHWRETVYRQSQAAGSFEMFWEGALRDGIVRTHSGNARPSVRPFRNTAFGQVPKYSSNTADGAHLALYSKISMHDGRGANNPWLQEMPDPLSSVTWDNYLNVSPSLAQRLILTENDVVEIKGPDFSFELPVHIQPGMHASVVSAAVGYGRRAAGKVGTGAGVDVFPAVGVSSGALIFSGQTVSLRKTARMYRLASTQWHTVTENRPVINDITLAQFKNNPHMANHTDPHLRLEPVPTLWAAHDYPGHRWGMAIDLTSCIGCGACVIACQAENNVPVVGREQVRVARQMHWLKIDRYYSGSLENPDVVFQPMLCQHCENAPCETVCPVLATVHDDEGLNVQVYNRCVGTRYCQNNCPYKVRRFNFFDHWKSYEGTMNLAWNPDISVRTRGVMEKCTFCVQRIRDAKDKAKDGGDRVRDGDFETACQQTCPTDAIVFGDMNDPGSRVSKHKADPRAFRVLEVLNTLPSISYLSKVRNKEAEGGHEGGEHHG